MRKIFTQIFIPTFISLRIQSVLSIVFLLALLFVPCTAFSATYYQDKTFSQSVVLRTANQPYYFSGNSTIARGATVTVEKGTKVYIDGNITVFGKLFLEGKTGSLVTITQSALQNGGSQSGESQNANPSAPNAWSAWGYSNQNPITLIGGELVAEYTQFLRTGGVVDAFATSSIYFDSVLIDGATVGTGSSVVTVFNNSTLTIKNSIFKNVSATYGIEVFNQSFLDVKNTTFTGVGTDSTLYVYGNGTTASILESRFYGGDLSSDTSIATSSVLTNTTQPKTQTALQIFSGAYVDISITDFERFDAQAISAFSNARLSISKTTFTKNTTGVKSFNSNIDIGDSDIFENVEQGAVLYGGTIQAINNWWGSETGPKSITLNPGGTGDVYVGTASISPWKQLKQKKPKCCSSILFIPGHQGSRIYKSGRLLGLSTENQLWEPNVTSDITKLFLNADGQSIDKTLYTRDIIDKTNIVYGGNDDIEIYKGLMKSLNGLNSNYSIEDWQYAVYDWRMSPNTIVSEGSRFGSSLGQYKRMEDQIVHMADISKTKKVTVLAHSYGGLVTKRLLTYLLQRGKIGLIDKVILVAVPESGSPSALFALLHGDNQDIGNGYIVNKSTMRNFAKNMPSAYALLPKVDQSLIYGMQATNTIAVGVPSVSTITSMYQFLFKEISRPSTVDTLETNIPFIANKKIKQKIDLESGSTLVKPQSEQGYYGIEFYNILGVGLNTPESISYTKKSCVNVRTQSYSAPSIMSPNCGLDHIQNFSNIGDGVVLAEDVFTQQQNQSQMVSQSPRWGEKFAFNIAEYNRKNNKNYSHANIVSSPPVISLLMQIVMGTIGEYTLPTYITAHGGKRMGGEGVLLGGVASVITSNQNALQGLEQHKRYQISASDAVFISSKDIVGDVIGMNFSLMSSLTNTATNSNISKIQTSQSSQIIPIKNTSPNSDVSHVGSSYYIHTEVLPIQMNLQPDLVVQENSFNLAIREVTPISSPSGSNGVVSQTEIGSSTSSTIALFQDIPITEYSNITVITSNTGTSTIFEMNVVDTYDDVFTSTSTYVVDTSVSPNAFLSSQGSQSVWLPTDSQNDTGGVLGGNGSGAGSGNVTLGGSIDIGYLITLIKSEIQSSGVRTNFKQRYLLKLSAIEKNYKSLIESKKRVARISARDITLSLAAIVKDLSRSRALNYTGGMKRAEASFLYMQFSRISRAFGD